MPDDEDLYKQIGKAIQQLRRQKNISQTKLAKRALLKHTYLTELESGKRKTSLRTLARIARAMDVRLVDLLMAACRVPGRKKPE